VIDLPLWAGGQRPAQWGPRRAAFILTSNSITDAELNSRGLRLQD